MPLLLTLLGYNPSRMGFGSMSFTISLGEWSEATCGLVALRVRMTSFSEMPEDDSHILMLRAGVFWPTRCGCGATPGFAALGRPGGMLLRRSTRRWFRCTAPSG